MVWSPSCGLTGLTPTRAEIDEYVRGNATPYLERLAELETLVDRLQDSECENEEEIGTANRNSESSGDEE
jgi:hypothetical protein